MIFPENYVIKEGPNMPYSIRKGSGTKPWKIVKKSTGETVGSSTSKAKAEASVRARHIHGH